MVGLVKCNVGTLNFRRANFVLFKILNYWVRSCGKMSLGVAESWQFFKDEFLKAQELSVPMYRKMSRGDKKLSLART